MSNPNSCLIFAMPQDIHAYAVGWALEQLRVQPRYFYTSDLPDRAAVRLEGGRDGPARLSFQCAEGWASPSNIWCTPDEFGSAWFRRSSLPTLRQDLGEGDRDVAMMDWSTITQSMELILQGQIDFCVNSPVTRVGRNHKFYHLWLAGQLGLKIPSTLIANDPESILRFVGDFTSETSRCIAKPLHLPTWQGDSGPPHVFTTTIVSQPDLIDTDLVSDPIIFQQEISKSFEVRITKIGSEYIAVIINSQSTEKGKLDFRLHGDWSDFGHELISIPENIFGRLKKLCDKLGLIFCTIDFIVDRNGDWIFLEVNHMGNWLWIEAYNPKIRLLSRMAQMLASGTQSYTFDESVDITLAPFLEVFEGRKHEIASEEEQYHVRDARACNVVDR